MLAWSLVYFSQSPIAQIRPVEALWCVALPVLDFLAVVYSTATLSSWWTRIVIGALLCAFCLLQRLIERHAKSVRASRRAPARSSRRDGERAHGEASAATDSHVIGRAPEQA